MEKANTKLVSMRFPLEVLHQLDELADIYGFTRTQTVCNMVKAEYDRVNGNSEAMEIIGQLKTLRDMVQKYNTGVTS